MRKAERTLATTMPRKLDLDDDRKDLIPTDPSPRRSVVRLDMNKDREALGRCPRPKKQREPILIMHWPQPDRVHLIAVHHRRYRGEPSTRYHYLNKCEVGREPPPWWTIAIRMAADEKPVTLDQVESIARRARLEALDL